VLIGDTYPLFRQGLRAVIEAAGDLEVVAEAGTGTEVLSLATTLNPDVAICDAQLPDIPGPDLTRRLRLVVPNLGVILMDVDEDAERLFEAVKAGASAYLRKTADPDDLLVDLRRVAAGAHLIDDSVLTNASVASKVLQQFNTLQEDVPREVTTLFAPLSPREIEILEQVSRGQSNKQIARNLAISDQTVKNHITSILKKLAVNDRTEAVVFSLRQGWIKVEGLS
jgi:DNA-binding NarL/FixJ family response regulator